MSLSEFITRPKKAMQIASMILAIALPAGSFAQTEYDDRLPDGSKSDGCTLIGGKAFRHCCIAHDRDYFFGGPPKARWESDKRLFDCILKKRTFGSKLAAPFIWLGVRIGGMSFFRTSFRWGFGRSRKAAGSVKHQPLQTGKNETSNE